MIVKEKFSFPETTEDDMETEIKCLDKNKPTTFNNIPAKHRTKIYNDTKENGDFPVSFKMEGITPAYKKGETTDKGNYRPDMYDQIYNYMNSHLSPYLCGFRKNYSAQYCLIAMLER